MAFLDFEKFATVPLQQEPCSFLVVPQFVKAEALEKINSDYPRIEKPGNFPLEGLEFGPAFQQFLDEMQGPEMRRFFSEKFGMDLNPYPTQMTIRRYASADDGHIHNDSVTKKITVLVYLNRAWDQRGGRLRILRSESNLDDYAVEVNPCGGTMLAFRRNEHSYHGFHPCGGERRTVQMYWVDPKRAARGEKKKRGPVAKFMKRLLRKRR